MNKQTEAEQGPINKNPENIPADAVLLGEGSLSFPVLLFDECKEKADKESEKDAGA